MNKRFKLLTLIGVFSAFAIGSTTLIVNSQTQNNEKQDDEGIKIRQKIQQNGDPIAEFNSSEPANPQERQARQNRNKKFNAKAGRENTPRLDSAIQDFSITSWSSRGALPAFPNSSLVAIGLVTNANAFVSEDKTSVFSEFNFKIGKVLKNNTNISLQPGSDVTINRNGGKVRLPSGRVIFIGVDGLYMPKPNKEYLMFLKFDSIAQTYEITTGYEFNGGRVESLDGISLDGSLADKYRNYPKYNGMDVNQFVNLVINSLSNNQQ